MVDLPADLAREVRRTLTDLRALPMTSTAWLTVAADLETLATAVARADPIGVRTTLDPVSQATFEGKVRGRLASADQPAAMVVATKQTSALPAVGAASAALLIGIGYLLGGWLVAAVTSVFALFIFGVALAGTRTTKDRLERRPRQGSPPPAEPVEPAPVAVVAVIARIEASL